MKDKLKVTVLGTGQMGSGIVRLHAVSGGCRLFSRKGCESLNHRDVDRVCAFTVWEKNPQDLKGDCWSGFLFCGHN